MYKNWRDLIKPKKVQFEAESLTNTMANFMLNLLSAVSEQLLAIRFAEYCYPHFREQPLRR